MEICGFDLVNIFRIKEFIIPIGILRVTQYPVIRRSIADILRIGKCHFRLKHKVDKHHSGIYILCTCGNTHGIHKYIHAFFRVNKRKIGIDCLHCQKITCIIRRQRCIPVLHLVKDLIHDITLKKGLLLTHLGCHAIPVCLIGGIVINAEDCLRNSKRVARVIEHQHFSCILLIPQYAPACRCFGNHFRVINQTDHSHIIGNGILIVFIKIQILVLFVNQVVVG